MRICSKLELHTIEKSQSQEYKNRGKSKYSNIYLDIENKGYIKIINFIYKS